MFSLSILFLYWASLSLKGRKKKKRAVEKVQKLLYLLWVWRKAERHCVFIWTFSGHLHDCMSSMRLWQSVTENPAGISPVAFTDSESGAQVSHGDMCLFWPNWNHCICLRRRRKDTYPQTGRERCLCRQDVACPSHSQAGTGCLPGQESAQPRALIDKHWAIQLHPQRHNSSQPCLTPFPLCSAGLSSQIKAHNLEKTHFCWQWPHVHRWVPGLPGKLCQCRSRTALVSASQSGY